MDVLSPKVKNKLMSFQGIDSTKKRILMIYLLVSLGLAHHFKDEINETLQEGFEKIEEMMDGEDDLYTVSIIFWVLRRYGHNLSSDVFRRFKKNNGNYKDFLTGDAKGLLSLYEPAHLRTMKDGILDEALMFASSHLKSIAACGTCPPYLSVRIQSALILFQHWNMEILVPLEYIPFHEQEKDHDVRDAAQSICVQNLLSNKTVRSFENIREEEINVMMDKLEKASSSSSRVNLSKLLTALTNDVIARIVLGRKYSSEEDGNNSNTLVRRYMEIVGAFPFGEYFPSLAWVDKVRGFDRKVDKLNNEIDRFLEKVVQEHVDADEGRSNFVGILLSTQRDKTTPFELDRTSLKNLLLDMLFGGSASTFTLLEWTMTELMRHPNCMKKLQDEIRSVTTHNSYALEKEAVKMNYLNAVIKEVLRLHPSGTLVPRKLSEDVKLNEYDIAAGTHVLINVWAIQRDIATWPPDADEFRPERHLDSLLDFQGNDFKYIPFGSGRRKCPGIELALALVEVTLVNLVNRFDWRIEVGPRGDDKHHLVEASGMDVCRKFPLFAFPSPPLFSM
ncbi:hypothetical protein Bca52824_011661 [Brassica carinata]|uniref:Terpene synthase N-terminal domain-containing protein n=1 Tax=Brassica carinata TaxID=52824 RepID=A0A8X7VXG8_BRACI|nr:hypothetical protein Bca52824_011661 [Brassica carinata]